MAAASLVACATAGDDEGIGNTKADPNGDINTAVENLPEARVLATTPDGVPTFIEGEFAKVTSAQTDDRAAADTALRASLNPVLAPFRLTTDNLRLRKINTDEDGNRHFRYNETYNGLDVVGGDLVVHLDVKGAIVAVNGTARGDFPATLGQRAMGDMAALAAINADSRFAGLTASPARLVYIITADSKMYKAYEVVMEGQRGPDPARDKVYVDVDGGSIVAVYPQIHFAENRKVYNLNHGTSLPGTLARSEGQAAVSDIDVNAAYDNTGAAYEAYKNFWNRDSYNNAGAALLSSVHYSNNYCNAYWNGTQMVYGDGSGTDCLPLARSVDVTAHELTHAVTENESGLVYSGESGGMNEAMSDIFGAFAEAWVGGGKNGTLLIDAGTFLVGEDILPPFLRNMCDPKADGASADQWSSTVGNLDVHYSSGVGNLAFCLLAKGGTHPRGATTINVPGVGFEKAIRIMYKAQTDYITSTAKYAAIRTSMESATTALGYDQATKDAVGCAWAAVKVGTAPTTCGGTTPPPTGDGVLTNGTAVTGIGDSQGNPMKFWSLDVPAGQTSLTFTISGGTGDADMYVLFNTKPTLTSYSCRPYINGNSETCTVTNPSAGKWWVGLNAYTTYSGVSLKGTYSATAPPTGDPLLTNGVPVTGISGATSSNQYWRINVPSGRIVTIRISGGTGDADLYTRFGARPTTTTYSCRPYLNGNSETCSGVSTSSGDWYIMLRGYTSYSGVSLIASY